MNGIGYRVWGTAAIASGIIGLRWREFGGVWQPVPETMLGHRILVYVCAAALLAGGAAVEWRRSARAGAVALMCVYAFFGFFWLRRVVEFPRIEAVWSGLGEQVALIAAGLAVFALMRPTVEGPGGTARRVQLTARILFGLCAISWGLAHFTALPQTTALVPKWLPRQRAWAIGTGVCHLLAGLSIVSGVWALVASRLETAMIVGFGTLVWIPQIVSYPTAHVAWAGNAINLALLGAAWVIADSIRQCEEKVREVVQVVTATLRCAGARPLQLRAERMRNF